VTTSPDTVAVAGVGHVDVARTWQLWKGVYTAPAAIIKRGDWVDRPSAGIAAVYTTTALVLGAALDQSGRTTDADRVRRAGVEVAEAAHVLEWFTGPTPNAPPPVLGSDAPRGAPVPVRP
jgi:hypothetical protein